MSVAASEQELFLKNFSSSGAEGESDLLKRFRNEAWQKLLKVGLPDYKSETFQYVSFKHAFAAAYQTIENPNDIFFQPLDESKRSHIVFVNGMLRLDLSNIEALPKSCVVRSLKDASRTYATLISNRFSAAVKREQDPFCLLTMACYQEGLFLYIPPKVILEEPIEIIHILTSSTNAAVLPRVQLFMGAHAEANLAVTVRVNNCQMLFSSMLFDCSLEDGARLHVAETFLDSGSGFILNAFRATIKRSSCVNAVQLSHGKIPVRFDTKAELAGDGAEAFLSGLWITSGKEECHTNVVIEHKQPHTHSNQLFKGVLFDKSRSSFQGKIYVHQEAQKTQAYQLNNNLLLSDEAEANSKPNLEIFADDVKASHGATVGQLDPEQVFYLKTRGFSETEAKAALIKGFCEEVAQRIRIPSLQASVEQMIASITLPR